jgi:putative ABC transport system permease protein
MISLIREIRPAVRRLGRTPGFTIIAILTLALGIGANSAMFSIVNAVLLEPLPYNEPDRLVRIWGSSEGFEKANVNPLDALDWRSELRSVDTLAIFHAGEVTLRYGDGSLRVPNARVTSGYFEMLGVRPIIGTTFPAKSEVPGQDEVAILSYGLWQSTFGGDRDVLGRTIGLGDRELRVVGVMPKGYRDPLESWVGDPVLWRPMAIDRENQGRGGHFMQVFARLASDAAVADVQAETDALMERLEKLYPSTNTGYRTLVEPLHATIVGDSRQVLTTLMGAVGIVLLIGCVNVANLLLARGAARGRELAIRTSLGASRFSIARMMIVESSLIAAAGAMLAVLVCRALTGSIGSLVEGRLLVRNPIEVDVPVLVFTLVVSALAAVVCALVPALHASSVKAFTGLKETGRSGGVGRGGRRAMRGLVVAQLALSAIILVVAGLMVRSLQNLASVDPGFDAGHVVAVGLRLSPAAYPEESQIFAFHDELRERLTRRSVIREVGVTNIMPFGAGHSCEGYLIEGEPDIPGGAGPCAETRAVSPSYFDAMGIPIVGGRGLDATDEDPESPGIVISRSLAATFDGDPIGQRVRLGIEGEPWATVVGVAGDVRHASLADEPPPTLYMPFKVNAYYSVMLVARTSGDPGDVIPDIRSGIRDLDPTIPLNRIDTIERLISTTLGADRLRTGLLGGFGLLALVLAVSGIYGVFSFLVAAERRDTGIRMALGADRWRILGEVVRDVAALAAVGVALGVAGSIGAGRMVEAFLHGVSTTDVTTLTVVACGLLAVSLLACLVPARRAMRVDLMQALREE